MTTCSIAVINQQAPFSSFAGKDAQDLALIFGSYEQNVSMFFIGDGVYHLHSSQMPENISAKDYLKTYTAFEFYDIEHIYVCESSLSERKIPLPLSLENVKVISPKEMSVLIKAHQTVFNF